LQQRAVIDGAPDARDDTSKKRRIYGYFHTDLFAGGLLETRRARFAALSVAARL
jgi:hypothetical protein